jgi:predicted CoA-binding protein
MLFENPSTPRIRSILQQAKTIAVVGISEREDRASNYVSDYMQSEGYKIYPVNPNIDVWFGLESYESVQDVPEKVDIVDVFRRSANIMPVAEDAVASGAKVLWLQQGIVNQEAATFALDKGLAVVMDYPLLKP